LKEKNRWNYGQRDGQYVRMEAYQGDMCHSTLTYGLLFLDGQISNIPQSDVTQHLDPCLEFIK
jgi:hypothetical protein